MADSIIALAFTVVAIDLCRMFRNTLSAIRLDGSEIEDENIMKLSNRFQQFSCWASLPKLKQTKVQYLSKGGSILGAQAPAALIVGLLKGGVHRVLYHSYQL